MTAEIISPWTSLSQNFMLYHY